MSKSGNYKHGYRYTKVYNVWRTMKSRCCCKTHPKYHRYGGRGITVCSEWLNDPKAFCEWALANGYKEGLSIDRIDNDKGYSPENCRWTTMNVQALNRKQHPSNTGCLGVYRKVYNGKRGTTVKYIARVKRNGIMHVVGRFKTLEEAVSARNAFVESLGVE